MKVAFGLLLCGLFSTSVFASEFIPEASGVSQFGDVRIIAGDEEPKALWVSQAGGSVEKVKVKGAAWDDMEALASVAHDKFFGITSHSLTKKGKAKPEREQLILFARNQKKIEAIRSWNLRPQAIALLSKKLGHVLDMNAVQTGTPDHGGFNIEGMAYLSGSLYLGLRSPITSKGEAIILVVKNAESQPTVSDVMTVSLSGRGIRGLESDQGKLMILSGSADDTDQEFSVDVMSLDSRMINKMTIPGFEKLLRPEGLAVVAPGQVVFVQDFQSVENQDVIVHLEASSR